MQISFGFTKTNKKARNSLTIIIDNDCHFSCFLSSGVLPGAEVPFSSVGAAVVSSGPKRSKNDKRETQINQSLNKLEHYRKDNRKINNKPENQ